MKRTTKSLFTSALSLFLCVVMLLGTTFAWFTDVVTSDGNKVVAGTLKVDLELLDKDTKEWNSVKENKDPIFSHINWEPGYTEVKVLKVENEGSLALKWKAVLVAENQLSQLANVIDVYVLSYGVLTDEDASTTVGYPIGKPLASYQRVGTLAEFVNTIEATISGNLKKDESAYFGIAFKMQDSAGNEYQNIDLGGAFDLNIVATQDTVENDSFGNDYDKDATFPGFNADFAATASVVGKVGADNKLTDVVTIGDTEGDIYANVPAGVKLDDGVSKLKLTVVSMHNSEANVTASHRSEVLHSVDVHIDGVASDNDKPMVITLLGALPGGLNSNNVHLYHVEDGVTYPMTLVDNPTGHNEFSYNPATGDVVISIASFSEIALYGDTKSEWDGVTVANGFGGGTGTEADPYIIANAEQLVYFRNEVDGGRTFEGEFVKLTANVDLNEVNFDPIGWGYDYDGFTAGGKTFNGTFDGENHTIYGLYQNGWDLDPDKENYSNYTYSMAGGGLFASVVDATIKNLTISGAYIVFECVDMGVLVGYAQGNCTFKNISIINSKIQNYNRYTGGVVGECSPRYDENGTPLHSNHLFEDITVDSTTVISSLWGSFDTSLGGILGGKWDKNGAETQVTMRRCNVACQIDAFNDVTSAYQWYAYRRAGMLIGNTEQSANNKALANFLTCEDVCVIYGSWNNYHYCEFTNQSGSENADWQNNYPWVRVEAGLSCNAYSNPRYGHPIVNGVAINSAHTHENGDECTLSLAFKQLYGGGQGVYGATEHEGVTEGAYTVTYMDGDKTVKVDVVSKNDAEYTLWGVENYASGGWNPSAWVDINGVEVTSIAIGNKAHHIVYAQWPEILTFSLVDPENNVLYSREFQKGKNFTPNAEEIAKVLSDLQNKVDSTKETITVSWETDIPTNLKDESVVIMAEYTITIKGVDVELEGVYNKETGELEGYKYVDPITSNDTTVTDVEIPGYIGDVPVIEVQVAAGAFAGNEDLVSIKLPANLDSIGSGALENGPQGNSGSNITKGRSEITIYYSGTAAQWQEYMDATYRNKENSKYTEYNKNITIGEGEECLASDWDYGLEKGSRIFFLGENGKVDQGQGYWELYYSEDAVVGIVYRRHYTWVYHNHAYDNTAHDSNCSEYHNKINTNYTDSSRGDSKYWN